MQPNETPQQHTAKTTGAVIGIAMLVVGGLAGFGIAKASNNDSNDMSMNMSSTATATSKAGDLRASLVTLGVEHMTYTDQAIDAALDGSPNATASATALYANGNDIGAAVGSVYGKSAETTFDSVWKLHLDDFVKYAVAGKQGNSTDKAAALADIDANYTKPLAAYLAKANPNLPEATLLSSLRDHVQMTAQMIDDHVAGNYTAEANDLTMANTHMKELFSTLAAAIVKQYPSKF